MPQVVTGGPANGWYGSSLFGSGGFGGAGNGGSFPNQFGGGFNTGPNGSAWGNETFVAPQWGSGANAGTGLPGSSPFSQIGLGGGSPSFGGPSFGGGGTQFNGGFGGGSALSGGYGTHSIASFEGGSYGGGQSFGGGAGSSAGGASFGGGGTQFNTGAESGLGQAQQLSALSSSLGSGGSITPQFLEMANSLGLSSPQAQAFASLDGQQQQQQQINPADLPSQFASETSGFGSPNYSLAQIIQSEAGNSQAGQFAVAATLANREANPAFAQQYGDLIGQANAAGQFTGHLTGPSGPGQVVSPSQVSSSAQQIAQALQNGTLGNLGQLGNALYFLAQSSPGGAQMAAARGTPIGGGTVQTNNVFSNALSPLGPTSSYNPPQYTLGNYAQAAADPFGTAYGGPSGPMNLFASGFPVLQSGANGYGYPAYASSTMSDSLLGNMGFNTNSDFTSQLIDQMGLGNAGYGDAGYGGGSSQSDTSSSYTAPGYTYPAYTYGNDIGNNPSDYSDIGGYSPSYGADFGSGGVTDLGSYDSSGGSFDSSGSSGSSGDSGGY